MGWDKLGKGGPRAWGKVESFSTTAEEVTFHGARIYNDASQNITAGSSNLVSFNQTRFDTDSFVDLANEQFVIPTGQAGYYLIGGNLTYSSPTTKADDGWVGLYIRVNDSYIAHQRIPLILPDGAYLHNNSVCTVWQCAAADTVRLYASWNASGGSSTRALQASNLSVSPDLAEFFIAKWGV